MVLKQKTARKQGAPSRCCHRIIPTVSASSLTTTAWWPMPACSCRPPLHSTWAGTSTITSTSAAHRGGRTRGADAGRFRAGRRLHRRRDALRAGGTVGVLGCVVKAPSTLGTFLRTCPSTRPGEPPVAGTHGPLGPDPATCPFDLDSTKTMDTKKGRDTLLHLARGYHHCWPSAGTGDVLMSRLREGRANTARGAAHFLRETVGRVRYGGERPTHDSFYAHRLPRSASPSPSASTNGS